MEPPPRIFRLNANLSPGSMRTNFFSMSGLLSPMQSTSMSKGFWVTGLREQYVTTSASHSTASLARCAEVCPPPTTRTRFPRTSSRFWGDSSHLVSVDACCMMMDEDAAAVGEAASSSASSSAQNGRVTRIPWNAGPGPMAATTLLAESVLPSPRVSLKIG